VTLHPGQLVTLCRTSHSTDTDTLPAVVQTARRMPVSGRWIYTFDLGNRWRVLTQDMLGQVVSVDSSPLAAAA
jgi:hypothetical protein